MTEEHFTLPDSHSPPAVLRFLTRHPSLWFMVIYLAIGSFLFLLSSIFFRAGYWLERFFMTVFAWPLSALIMGFYGSTVWKVVALAIGGVAVIFIWLFRRQFPSRPRVTEDGESQHGWWWHWWWIILFWPVVIIMAVLTWAVGTTAPSVWAYDGLGAGWVLVTVGLARWWWHRGGTGKVMVAMFGLVTVAVVVPIGLQVWRSRQHYVRIERQAASNAEKLLIQQAERTPCPGAATDCFLPLDDMSTAERTNKQVTIADLFQGNPHTEVDYSAQVGHGFPVQFSWSNQSFGLERGTFSFFNASGKATTAETCLEQAGPGSQTVGMHEEFSFMCGSLCGSGSVQEKQILFNSKAQLICQGFVDQAHWISRLSPSIAQR